MTVIMEDVRAVLNPSVRNRPQARHPHDAPLTRPQHMGQTHQLKLDNPDTHQSANRTSSDQPNKPTSGLVPHQDKNPAMLTENPTTSPMADNTLPDQMDHSDNSPPVSASDNSLPASESHLTPPSSPCSEAEREMKQQQFLQASKEPEKSKMCHLKSPLP